MSPFDRYVPLTGWGGPGKRSNVPFPGFIETTASREGDVNG